MQTHKEANFGIRSKRLIALMLFIQETGVRVLTPASLVIFWSKSGVFFCRNTPKQSDSCAQSRLTWHQMVRTRCKGPVVKFWYTMTLDEIRLPWLFDWKLGMEIIFCIYVMFTKANASLFHCQTTICFFKKKKCASTYTTAERRTYFPHLRSSVYNDMS